MKFLKNVDPAVNHIMLLNIMYFNERNFDQDDVLSIVYKDMDTGEKFVENINKPKIEVYIVKPEYRKKVGNVVRDYYPKEWMEPVKVRYRNRYSEIAKILDLPNKEFAKVSPYVAWSNMDIRSYYCIQFTLEYANDLPKKINCGFLDIENDIIEIDHFPENGETPISLITYIDEPSLSAYTFCLRSKHCSYAIDPDTGEPYDCRDQQRALEADNDGLIKELHEKFDDIYGKIDYNILWFDDELVMIKKVFQIIEACNCDFCMIWNMPYDIGNLVARPNTLLANPVNYICSDLFEVKEAYFKEDNNPIVHKRKHEVRISHPTVFLDQMVMYAGIRSAKGKIPSLKLNAIGRTVMNDEKIDYSEEGNIRTIMYKNYRSYVIYNIKDVLLLLGISRKTGDIEDIYTRMEQNAELSNEVFTTTTMLTNSIYVEFYRMGYIAGNNRNKMDSSIRNKLNAQAQEDAEFEFENPDDYDDFELNPDTDDSEESSDDEQPKESKAGKKKNRKQFEGALVQNPKRMLPSGVVVNGIPNDKIHDDAIDQDATSLYPTTMRITNSGNETLIGRVEFIDDKYDFFKKLGLEDQVVIGEDGKAQLTPIQEKRYLYERIPMYGYTFVDKEDEESYKLNLSDDFAMKVSEDAVEEITTEYLNLPSMEEMMQMYSKMNGSEF